MRVSSRSNVWDLACCFSFARREESPMPILRMSMSRRRELMGYLAAMS